MLRKSVLFTFTLLTSILVTGQNPLPERPEPAVMVNNFSKAFPEFLSAEQQQKLERKLENFAVKTSNQIAIVIVDDLGGQKAAEYAKDLANSWGIGQEALNNGILILIKPTGEAGERQYFISIGKGLEEAIPAKTTEQIAAEKLIPSFRNGNFYKGLDETTDALMPLAKKAYNYPDYKPGNK